jgi:hypothetical protein
MKCVLLSFSQLFHAPPRRCVERPRKAPPAPKVLMCVSTQGTAQHIGRRVTTEKKAAAAADGRGDDGDGDGDGDKYKVADGSLLLLILILLLLPLAVAAAAKGSNPRREAQAELQDRPSMWTRLLWWPLWPLPFSMARTFAAAASKEQSPHPNPLPVLLAALLLLLPLLLSAASSRSQMLVVGTPSKLAVKPMKGWSVQST